MLLHGLRSHLTRYPSPANLSYAWNFGFLASIALLVQISTGVFLAMHYVPHTAMAFASVEHIMRDVSYGWLLRYGHANGASLFFMVVYGHMLRGLFYHSFAKPRQWVWCSGVLLFLVMILTAFIGYVLPWGQMSLWGATVITNLASAIPIIGDALVQWLWGGFAVSHATLVRFYSLHYLMPFLLSGLVMVHILLLHQVGSSNPIGMASRYDMVSLYPYFIVKDMVGLLCMALVMLLLVAYASEALGHSDNAIEANSMVTPLHIVPEWYFLPLYAILRSIPHKLLGVVAMVSAILVLLVLPWLHMKVIAGSRYLPISRLSVFSIVLCWLVLAWIGGMPVEAPYVLVGQIASLYYFGYFLVLQPIVDATERALITMLR
nr:cytochrome b [Bangiopsis subsimplex]